MQDPTVKIQKVNLFYLIAYILGPIIICALCYTLCYFCFRNGGTGAVLTTVVPTILALLWWFIGGTFIFKQKTTKALEKRFESEGYARNQTFYGRGKTVIVDVNKGAVGIAFFWNPFQTYIVSASRIAKTWVDDGKIGSGIMEGSSHVSFIFFIDDIKIKVDTFISNQRFRMDDRRILTGISKANTMASQLNQAKANAKSH